MALCKTGRNNISAGSFSPLPSYIVEIPLSTFQFQQLEMCNQDVCALQKNKYEKKMETKGQSIYHISADGFTYTIWLGKLHVAMITTVSPLSGMDTS